MKEFIIKQFEILGDKIRSHQALSDYVDFCYSNSLNERTPRTTALHHILPRAKLLPFSEYSNLSNNPWNGVILTNYNHYYAHYLLVLAVDHISVAHSFCAMHKKDLVIGRLAEQELISEDEFNRIYEERNRRWSERTQEIITIDGKDITRAAYFSKLRSESLSDQTRTKYSENMIGSKNIVYMEGVVDKIRETKIAKGLDQISADRAAKTMKTEFVNAEGQITTIYRENGKKVSATLTQEFMKENGEITTLAKERGKKKKSQTIRDGKWFKIKNVFDPKVSLILPEAMVRQISPALMFKTRDDYLGMSKFGQTHFTKLNKNYLIGLYAEKLEEVPPVYNLDQDYSPYL